mmetsp:Transcript_55087/g.98283  ORF Transcript_55087/g.98283 Transcript_55087/m.98283 type:complete len:121 (+) Transcript_55087:99-461(+)
MTNESNNNPQVVQAVVVGEVVSSAPELVGAPISVNPTVVGTSPPGAPGGGEWRQEKVVGLVSLIIAGVLFFCGFWCCAVFPFCIPCDSKLVYRGPDGQVYNRRGVVLQEVACCVIYGPED